MGHREGAGEAGRARCPLRAPTRLCCRRTEGHRPGVAPWRAWDWLDGNAEPRATSDPELRSRGARDLLTWAQEALGSH